VSGETRLIRPFVGADEVQRALDSCSLRCAEGSVVGGGDISVSLDEYLNHQFTLDLGDVEWSQVKAGAADLGLDLADLDLIVLATAPRLRFSDVVLRQCLADRSQCDDQISLTRPERARSLRAPHGGTDLGVYVCLARSLEPRPLSPWRKGTWLGRVEYRIRSDLSGSGFVPIRMTDADRDDLGLPVDTSRFATLDDGDPFDVDPGPEAVKLYVDGELLDKLVVASATPVGRHIQRQLFLDAASAIVFAAQQRLAEGDASSNLHVDDLRGSLVHKLVEFIAGRGADTESRDLRQLEFRRLQEAPVAFLARVEATVGMRRDMLASLGEA
jgi:hypothetical protein